MSIELSFKEENGIVKITITTPDKPVMTETPADPEAPITVIAVQQEKVCPATQDGTVTVKDAEETAKEAEETLNKAEETLKAEIETLSAKLASMYREYERVRKAVYRTKKKLEELVVPIVPKADPGDNAGQAVTAYSNTNNTTTTTTNNNHITDHVVDHIPDHVVDRVTKSTMGNATEQAGTCLPFVPEGTCRFIPLADLPEAYRNVVDAWNQLPLTKKLKGLYPDVAEKLHTTLEKYGEASLRKAIRMVAESPFLLGKSSHSSGWVIYFGWLLKPGNLQKVLDNKYRNREPDREQNYYGASSPDYTPWTGAETCYLDPGIMTEGLTKLNEHARSCLEQAARTLGLKKEAVA